MKDLNELVQTRLGSDRVVVKSLVIAESYDGETKSLHVMGSDMPIWDVVGMLHVVCEDATAFYINIESENLRDEDEDGTL